MTKFLELAIQRLRQLPENIQDGAARVLIRNLEEEPELGDHEAIAKGRRAFERGTFISLSNWRNEMGLGNR